MDTKPTDRVRELIMGAWTTQVIHHGVRMKVFDALAAGARSSRDVADAVESDADGVFRLLRGAASLGLVRHAEDGTFSLTDDGRLLCADSVVSLRGVALHWGERIWKSFETLDRAVRTGRPSVEAGAEGFIAMQNDPVQADMFNRAMAEQSLAIGRDVARAYDFSAVRSVMDVGGGYGAVLRALLEQYPGLRGSVMDLPMIEARARLYLRDAGLGDRADYRGGNFFEAVPADAEAYVLKYIIHDWGDTDALRILRNCAAAARPGGRVLLVEQIVPDRITTEDQRVVRGDLIMMTVGGKERTLSEYRALCAGAGLSVTAVLPTPSGFSVIEARPRA